MSLVEMVEMSTSTKTCKQYDDWKEEQRINNPNTFISDKEYLEERKDYFAKWLQRLQERYDEQEYDTYKLPPYTLQELEQFQKLNKIYLPIHLVFYLTQFSRMFFKHHPAIFQIYDVDYQHDPFDEQVEITENGPTPFITRAQPRTTVIQPTNPFIASNTEQVQKYVYKIGNEIWLADSKKYTQYVQLKQIENEKKYPFLVVDMLRKNPKDLYRNNPTEKSLFLESVMHASCDLCFDDIIIEISKYYNNCDICCWDLCDKCVLLHHHNHPIVSTFLKEPIYVNEKDESEEKDVQQEPSQPEPSKEEKLIEKTTRFYHFVSLGNQNLSLKDVIIRACLPLAIEKKNRDRLSKFREQRNDLEAKLEILQRQIKRNRFEEIKDSLHYVSLQKLRDTLNEKLENLQSTCRILENWGESKKYTKEEQEEIKWRYQFGYGVVCIGSYGCGETETLIINGPNKGIVSFPKPMTNGCHLYIFSNSLLYYLLYDGGFEIKCED
uniref:ZZ-type domain-containing protein n=1 Tax=viral metagenome TaxID=1070528 RepID=A0A6C0JU70_9ZZZZ